MTTVLGGFDTAQFDNSLFDNEQKIDSVTVLNSGGHYILPTYVKVIGKTAANSTDHTTLPYWYNNVDTGTKLYAAAKMLSNESREIREDRWGSISYSQSRSSQLSYDAETVTGADLVDYTYGDYTGKAMRLDAGGESIVWKFDNYYSLRQSPTITITRANSNATITYSLDNTTYAATLPDATGYRYVYVKAAYNSATDYITALTYDALLNTSAADWFSIGLTSATIRHTTDSATNQAAWNLYYRERI